VLHLTAGDDGLWALYRTVDSTNSIARRILQQSADLPPDGSRAVLLAWEQKQGRGRHDRRWCSEPGEGILASLLISAVSHGQLAMMPLLVGVALVETVQSYLPGPVRLKWPNDILVADAKIGGVLVESISRGATSAVIVGFGLNHGSRPPKIAGQKTTSLALESVDPPTLARATVDSVEAVFAAVDADFSSIQVVEKARRLSCYRVGETIDCSTSQGPATGRYLGLDERGFLLLETESGLRSIAAGEVGTRCSTGRRITPTFALWKNSSSI
jgi:BirA family biotin operon repressor/biotin-[acetyl-CoA-carboxylase] ligase